MMVQKAQKQKLTRFSCVFRALGMYNFGSVVIKVEWNSVACCPFIKRH